ncbi:MAG TPA: PadR family transcriptional regulator [Actinomycetota bacterium]|nr:PadR family transcriptional regulator [Actinomycetota bacterium]
MAETARAEVERRELPVTSYAILGLLTFGERSGYDLVKLIEQSIGYFFTPAKSQIYAELRRLVSVGYATERQVAQERRPDKRLYAATDEGRRALRRWLEVRDVPPDEIKSPFMVKLFFGSHMSREAVLDQLEQTREQAREYLRELQTIERAIKDVPELFYPYLTLKCGLAYGRAQLRWVNQAIREVEEREGT